MRENLKADGGDLHGTVAFNNGLNSILLFLVKARNYGTQRLFAGKKYP